MIETEIKILINRKSDLEIIKQKIIDSKLRSPVYIFDYENHYDINFKSDYEEWELDEKILEGFPEYEFTTDLKRGRKEIRLQIHRNKSEYEDTLNETKYLIKKSDIKLEKFNPHVMVLFEEKETDYYIKIVDGEKKSTGQRGFLLLKDFKSSDIKMESDFFKDVLYRSKIEAFNAGYYKMQDIVTNDFKEYIEQQKKKIKEQQKLPRKIIRHFIDSCNKSDINELLKNLDNHIVFEKRFQWQTVSRFKGLQEFKEFIKSSNQDLCGRDFIIRSYWHLSLPSITIRLKFPPTGDNKELLVDRHYGQITFTINDNKITSILVDQYK